MAVDAYIERILEDESLTDGLDEAEATLLVQWLVERVQRLSSERAAEIRISELRKRGRIMNRIVTTWRDESPESAGERAQRAGFAWPPKSCGTTHEVLNWLLNQEPNPIPTKQ